MQIRDMHEFVQTSTSKQIQLKDKEEVSEEMPHEKVASGENSLREGGGSIWAKIVSATETLIFGGGGCYLTKCQYFITLLILL